MKLFLWRLSRLTLYTVFALLAFQAFLVNVAYQWWPTVAKILPSLQPMLKPHIQRRMELASFSELLPGLSLLLVLSGVYLFLVRQAESDRHVHILAGALVLISSLCRLAWIIIIDSQPYGDYNTYWETGRYLASHGLAGIKASELFVQRSLFYTAPIHAVFGNSLTALELTNTALIVVVMVMYYEYGRRTTSSKVAAGALLIFVWNPDIWYGITLASPDIAFLPWLAACLLLEYCLEERLEKGVQTAGTLILSLSMGCSIFLVEVQRSFGPALWISLGVLSLSHASPVKTDAIGANLQWTSMLSLRRDYSKPVKAIVLFLVIPWASYSACRSFLRQELAGVATGPAANRGLVVSLAGQDVYGSGVYDEIVIWTSRYAPRIPPREQASFALRKLAHELLSDPIQTLQYLSRKNIVLAKPTTTLMFASMPRTDPSVGRINDESIPLQRGLMHMMAAITYLLLFLRLLLHPLYRLSRHLKFLVIFTSSFYLLILGVTEVQGRYDVFTVFLTSILLSELLVASPENEFIG